MNDNKAAYWCDKYHELDAQHKELTARIEELQKREAMLVEKMNQATRELCDGVDGTAIITLEEAINATPDETEAWLQAEILKRLKSEGYFMKHNGYWTKIADEYAGMANLGEVAELYRLPSPLATPEERIKEGRI